MNRTLENSIFPFLLIFLSGLNCLAAGSTVWLVFVVLAVAVSLLLDTQSLIGGAFAWSLLLTVSAVGACFAFYGPVEAVQSLLYAGSALAAGIHFSLAKNKSRFLLRVCGATFAGYFLQVALLLVKNAAQPEGQRTLLAIWMPGTISVTCVAVLCAAVTGYGVYLTVQKGNWRLLGILALALVTAINLRTATRAPILVLGLTLAVALSAGKEKTALVGALLMLLAALGGSALAARFSQEGLTSPRWEIFLGHLSKTFLHPFGGGKIGNLYGHAHNYIQNAHDLYGIGGLVAMLGLTADFLRVYGILWKRRRQKLPGMLLLVYTALLPQMLAEPVLTGYPIIFWQFLYIHTLTALYLREKGAAP